MMHRRLTKWVALAASVAAAACSDSSTITRNSVPAITTAERFLGEFLCSANTQTGTLACEAKSPLPAGINPDIILGGQNTYIRLSSFGGGFDDPVNPTVWSTNVQLQNLTVQPMGTRDSASATAGNPGIKVFFVQQPSNGVTVSNADGTGTFTSSGQPYYAYTQGNGLSSAFVAPGMMTDTKQWVFAPNGATTFTFTVLVSTTMPDEAGVLLKTNVTMPSSIGGLVNGVWGTSASNVYAISDTGEVFHYDGTSWTGGVRPATRGFNAIWGSSASDIYAVGNAGTVSHYNGTAWSTTTLTGAPDQLGVFGFSSSDVYSGGFNGQLWHWNGSTWTATTPTGLTTNNYIHSIWGTSANDLYIGGGTNGTVAGFFKHWDGSTWSDVNAGGLNGNNDINAIWGTSATDIWAGGYQGVLMHYNGTSWSAVNTATNSVKTSTNVSGIMGTSASDVWFSSYNGERLHWNGTNLVNYDPYDGYSMFAVYVAGPQRVFYGGYNSTGPTKAVVDYRR